MIPIYLVVGLASLVDNAVGAWAPTLLTREFHMDRAKVGMELGIMLTAAFGGGVLAGGWLADRAGVRGGWSRKLLVCLIAGALILPVAALINAAHVTLVLLSIPLISPCRGWSPLAVSQQSSTSFPPLARPCHVDQLLFECSGWRCGRADCGCVGERSHFRLRGGTRAGHRGDRGRGLRHGDRGLARGAVQIPRRGVSV